MRFDREVALGMALAGDEAVLRDYLEDCDVSHWFSTGRVAHMDLQEMYELGSREAYRWLSGVTLGLNGHLRAGLATSFRAADADVELSAMLAGRGPEAVVCWFDKVGWLHVPFPRLACYNATSGQLYAMAELRCRVSAFAGTPDALADFLTERLAPA